IAFDMVQRFEEMGDEVGFFGVFDTYPEENTTVPWLHRMYIYQRTLAMLWRQPPAGTTRSARSRLARVWRPGLSRLRPDVPVQGPTLRPDKAGIEAWEERRFPGPSWIPPKVKAHIDLFRVKKTSYWHVRDAEFGWGARTLNAVDVHIVGCDHDT